MVVKANNEASAAAGGNEDGGLELPKKKKTLASGDVKDAWGQVLEFVLPKSRITSVQRESCEAMRLVVFGEVGNEDLVRGGANDRKWKATYYEKRGTPDQMDRLSRFWRVLDHDGSGRVDIQELKVFMSRGILKL